MSNRIRAYVRSFTLYLRVKSLNLRVRSLDLRVKSLTQQLEEHHLRVKTLTQQFEELQQLRDRVRRAEVICAWQYRRRRKGYGSSPRSGGRVH